MRSNAAGRRSWGYRRSEFQVLEIALVMTTLAAVVPAAGCDRATNLEGRLLGLEDIIERADQQGAYRCAPKELALARAHTSFANSELARGNVSRAEEHFLVAAPNARAALALSPKDRCTGDRDGDGIPDEKDACPDDPEDFDGVDDEDGCPEQDDVDEDGIPDARDLCPVEPEDHDSYLDGDGCPEPDNDEDGVADQADSCKLVPEDPDDFVDEDGCPDLDNDADGLADVNDQCPNEPGPESERGCPKAYRNVEVTDTHIRIREKVHFEFNKAKIRSISHRLLKTVAQVLTDYPTITVEVQGHTDSRGTDEYNLELSDRRAEAVRAYLIEQDIEPSRLEARGYGESRPLESNRTDSGRAANRRVEFVRTDRK